MSERIEQQNAVIIALLARSVFTVEGIVNIVRRGKKRGKPDDFVRAYNALDGSTTAVTLAKMVGITQQAMGSVLQTWEDAGIVYKTGSGSQVRYYGLLKLPRNLPKDTDTGASTGKTRTKKRKTAIKKPSQPHAGRHTVDGNGAESLVAEPRAAAMTEDSAVAADLEDLNGTKENVDRG